MQLCNSALTPCRVNAGPRQFGAIGKTADGGGIYLVDLL